MHSPRNSKTRLSNPPNSTRGFLTGPCPWPRPDRLDIGRAAPTQLRTNRCASRNSPAVASRENRSPAFSARKSLGAAAAALVRDAGAAAGYRNGGRTGAGTVARRRRSRSSVANRRSRHRLRRNFARAAVRVAGSPGIRDRHFGGRLARRRRQCGTRGPLKYATFIACDYARGLTGPFDLIVSNPPYIRSADIDGLAAEVGESRSPGRARWRCRWAGRLPHADSPGGSAAGTGGLPCRGSRARPKRPN